MAKEMTIKEMVEYMKFFNEHNFNTYIEGRGDGSVGLIIEEKEITFR